MDQNFCCFLALNTYTHRSTRQNFILGPGSYYYFSMIPIEILIFLGKTRFWAIFPEFPRIPLMIEGRGSRFIFSDKIFMDQNFCCFLALNTYTDRSTRQKFILGPGSYFIFFRRSGPYRNLEFSWKI